MNRIQAQPAPPDALLHGWGPAGTFRDGYSRALLAAAARRLARHPRG